MFRNLEHALLNCVSKLKSLTTAQRAVLTAVVLSVGVAVVAVVALNFPSPSHQGYMPDQPIPFSHKLHAGELKMDCRYCHTNAYKSVHATVPPLSVCMNCHRVVKTDSPHIQKIKENFEKGIPIQWVRIHELPDHAHFNHLPHVKAGVRCQTCHGEIQTMDKVYQAEPLNMGWCKDCHEGQTTPMSVLRTMYPGDEEPEGKPVAPLNCSTCHY